MRPGQQERCFCFKHLDGIMCFTYILVAVWLQAQRRQTFEQQDLQRRDD